MRGKIFFFFFLIIFLNLNNPTTIGKREGFLKGERGHTIEIPSISVEENICTGERDFCLNGGVWMKYYDERGNILLTGHSFNIIPFGAGVFFSLSDMKEGQKVHIFFKDDLVFKINEVFVASRYDVHIEDFTKKENSLVIYSCFPLWSASKRIVVRGQLCELCEGM